MSLFDYLVVQPIFNILVLIYGLLPGGDFGIAVILFTVLIRLLMWPLVKKQLHQTKVMRKVQPELKKIKVKAKGNKQLEAQMMMELYRERGVNPFSSIGLLLVQLPIFIALFQVINIITSQRERIAEFTYDQLENLRPIREIIANPEGFNETLLGIVNLAERALTFTDGSLTNVHYPIIIIALAASITQYYQTKQVMPQSDDKKRLRDILKQQAEGKEVDQSEITTAVSSKMMTILPVMTFGIGLYLPGALVLYFLVSSLVAVAQQHVVLSQDVEEMETLADKKTDKKSDKKFVKMTDSKSSSKTDKKSPSDPDQESTGATKSKKRSSSEVKVRRFSATGDEITESDASDDIEIIPPATTPTISKKKNAGKKKRKRR